MSVVIENTSAAPAATRDREPVGTGMILCSGLKVGPVTVFRNPDGSLDAAFKIVDVHITKKS